MGIIKCCVPFCKDRVTSRRRFPHPVSDAHARYKKWISRLNIPKLTEMDPMMVYKNKRICGRHFSIHCYVPGSVALKRNCIPDRNLPGGCYTNINAVAAMTATKSSESCPRAAELVSPESEDQSSPFGVTEHTGNAKQHNHNFDATFLDLINSSQDRYTSKEFAIFFNKDEKNLRNVCQRSIPEANAACGREARNVMDPSMCGSDLQCPSLLVTEKLFGTNITQKDGFEENSNSSGTIGGDDDTLQKAEDLDPISKHRETKVTSDFAGGFEVSKGNGEVSCERNDLACFFAAAFRFTEGFPKDLQVQIKRDILKSIIRAEKQVEKGKSRIMIKD